MSSIHIIMMFVLFAIVSHYPVGASFLCYKCDNHTASGREFCSTEQALDKNKNEMVDDCTANANILACYIRVTYRNNTVDRFTRGCASSRICGQNDTDSCRMKGITVTCTSCCRGNYCNNRTGLPPPTATTGPNTTSTTGPNTTSYIHNSGIVQSPLRLLYAIVCASLLFLAFHQAD